MHGTLSVRDGKGIYGEVNEGCMKGEMCGEGQQMREGGREGDIWRLVDKRVSV